MTGAIILALHVIGVLLIFVAILIMVGIAALTVMDWWDERRQRHTSRESLLPNLTHHHTNPKRKDN